MDIQGLQKMTLLDYPGKVACTVFLGGCDFRCPFCHNGELVLSPAPAQMDQEELLAFLKKRQGLLDGVCITGGEPLLRPDLKGLLEAIHALGYPVKLDTNGSHPRALVDLVERKLVDYVAMDIKNAPEKYPITCGIPGLDTAPVAESVKLLRQSGVDFEFRTTLVREFHTPEDLLAIGRWLEGSPRYFLQAFVDSGNLVGSGCSPFTPQEMRDFTLLLRPFFREVSLRGVD